MQKRLNHLIGADLVMLHFAGDMSMWGFSGSSFSSQLHVQCSYRLTYSNKNLLCQSDVFTIVNYGKFNTLLHLERDLIKLFILPVQVTNAILYDNQDIEIYFGDDLVLYVYADSVVTEEQWRYWEELYGLHGEGPEYIAIDGTIKSYKGSCQSTKE